MRREVTRVVATLTAKLAAAQVPPTVVWVKPAALRVTIRFIGDVEATEVTLYRSELSHRGPNYTGLVNAPLIGTST